MIKLSRMADYAVMLMGHMAKHPNDVLSAHVIADQLALSAPTVSKLLKLLHNADLLTSTRGLKGGYGLAASASNITVASIISAIDGPIGLTACVEDTAEACDIASFCPTRTGWQRINNKIKAALEEVSLEDMITPVPFTTYEPGTAKHSVEQHYS